MPNKLYLIQSNLYMYSLKFLILLRESINQKKIIRLYVYVQAAFNQSLLVYSAKIHFYYEFEMKKKRE